MTDDLIRPLRGAYPGPAIEPDSSIRDQLALLGKVGVRYGGLNNATASPLLTDIAAYWKLDNLTWTDSVGGNTLTNNNGVNVGTPKVGAGSAEFDKSSGQRLDVSTASLNPGAQDFSLACWFKTSTPDKFILSKGGISVPGYSLYLDGAGSIRASIFNTGRVQNTTIGPYDNNLWHFVVVTYERDGNANIYVDDMVTPNATFGISSQAGDIQPATPFKIGARENSGDVWDGLIDEVGIWKRILTEDERKDLYNFGSGLSYPFS